MDLFLLPHYLCSFAGEPYFTHQPEPVCFPIECGNSRNLAGQVVRWLLLDKMKDLQTSRADEHHVSMSKGVVSDARCSRRRP